MWYSSVVRSFCRTGCAIHAGLTVVKQALPCSSRGIVILQVWELILRSLGEGGWKGTEGTCKTWYLWGKCKTHSLNFAFLNTSALETDLPPPIHNFSCLCSSLEERGENKPHLTNALFTSRRCWKTLRFKWGLEAVWEFILEGRILVYWKRSHFQNSIYGTFVFPSPSLFL